MDELKYPPRGWLNFVFVIVILSVLLISDNCARCASNSYCKTGYFEVINSGYPFKVYTSDIQGLGRLNGAEFVWLAHWEQRKAIIDHVETQNDVSIVYFRNGNDSRISQYSQSPTYAYIEFPASASYGRATFVTVQGNNLCFEGRIFGPSTGSDNLSYLVDQATLYEQGGTPLAGAVEIKSGTNITFRNCTFKDIGEDAIIVHAGVGNVNIINCNFTNIGASAIVLNPEAKPYGIIGGNISGNTIKGYGCEYADAAGILVTYSEDLTISNNTISNGSYTGISLGWGWGEVIGASSNTISDNTIYDVVKLLDDGAGIYTLGSQAGTVITANNIYDLIPSAYNGGNPICGIYLDEGSSGITVENNSIGNVPIPIYEQNVPGTNPAHDNVIKNNAVIPRGEVDN
jgi:hypothetical protein